jgi:hypothetical protein
MIGPETIAPIRRVFVYRPVDSPGPGIICWNSVSPTPAIAAKHLALSGWRAMSMTGPVT